MRHGAVGRRAMGALLLGLVLAAIPRVAAVRFLYPSFLNRPYLNLGGDAHVSFDRSGLDAELLLCGTGRRHREGSMWFAEAQDLSMGFNTQFNFSLRIPRADRCSSGSDGFAFVAQSESAYAIGTGGGYGFEGLPGIAVDFATLREPGEPPVSVMTVHHSAAELHVTPPDVESPDSIDIPLLDDADDYSIIIDYKPPLLQVFMWEAALEQPAEPLLTFDMPNTFKGAYWLGFTGASAGGCSVASVASWGFWSSAASPSASARSPRAFFVPEGPRTATTPDIKDLDKLTPEFDSDDSDDSDDESGVPPESSSRRLLQARRRHRRGQRVRVDLSRVCADGFSGHECAVDVRETRKQCPRISTCHGCTTGVYDCTWCMATATCHAGPSTYNSSHESWLESAAACDAAGTALRPTATSAHHGHVCTQDEDHKRFKTLKVVFTGLALTFFIVSAVLWCLVPTSREQRLAATRLLVSLMVGAGFGYVTAVLVTRALVEISLGGSLFSRVYGTCATVSGFFVAFLAHKHFPAAKSAFTSHANRVLSNHGQKEPRVRIRLGRVVLYLFAILLFASGMACFAVSSQSSTSWAHSLTPLEKVPFFAVMGTSISFVLVFFSLYLLHRTRDWVYTTFVDVVPQVGGREVLASSLQLLTVCVTSLLCGSIFGTIFGFLDMEDLVREVGSAAVDSVRFDLLNDELTRQGGYSYLVGTILGAVGGVVNEALRVHSGDVVVDLGDEFAFEHGPLLHHTDDGL